MNQLKASHSVAHSDNANLLITRDLTKWAG